LVAVGGIVPERNDARLSDYARPGEFTEAPDHPSVESLDPTLAGVDTESQ
jgi:hypothetical protein